MEDETVTAEMVERVDSFVAAGDFRGALHACEDLELHIDGELPLHRSEEARNAALNLRCLAIQMALYILFDELESARHFWKRLPAPAKGGTSEVPYLWNSARCFLLRNVPGAYASLERQWSPQLEPMVEIVVRRLRQRHLALMAKVYTALPLVQAAGMLGMDAATARVAVLEQGWAVDDLAGGAAAGPLVRPDRKRAAAAAVATAASGGIGVGGGDVGALLGLGFGGGEEAAGPAGVTGLGPAQLKRLTESVVFLESKRISK